jgi:hypothetical protein
VKAALKAMCEEPIPDARAKPIRAPPQYLHKIGRSWEGIDEKEVNWELTSLNGRMDHWA